MNKKLLLLSIVSIVSSTVILAQTIPNSGMEDWTSTTDYDSLNSWGSSNLVYKLIDETLGLSSHPSSVLKHSGGHSGSYSVEIKNVVGKAFNTPIDTVPGFILATSGTGGNLVPGFPISSRPAFLTGFYQFTQGGSGTKPDIDSAFIAVGFTRYNTSTNKTDSIGGGMMFITSTKATFTSFAIPIFYLPNFTGIIPDTATIFITSSIAQKSFPNTSLIIDDLSFSSATGVKNELFTNGLPSSFPNPISTDLTITNLPNQISSIDIKDFTGTTVFTSAVHDETIRLNMGHLNNGIYLYSLKEEDGTVVYTAKFVVAR